MSKQRVFSVATSLSSTIQLNDGVLMPLFGLGMFRTGAGELTENAVLNALQAGYRMFDTAQYYGKENIILNVKEVLAKGSGKVEVKQYHELVRKVQCADSGYGKADTLINEAEVERALRKSGFKRDDVFVVSKVWTANHGYDTTTASVRESLSKMETDRIDMFLIHGPSGGKVVETYKALLDLKAKGHIRSVGVSNFGIHHLEGLKAAGLPPPSVNQIELHPFAKRPEIVQYCRDHNIGVMGYSPLARCQKDDDPDLITIAKNHKRSIAQVMIRWSVQMGFITIPKSSKQERIISNAQVFDFELTEQDMQTLNSKPNNFHVAWDPTTSPWVD